MTQTKLRNHQVVQNPTPRNLIIDGAMQIAQAGTSEAGVTTSGYKKAVDMWYLYLSSLGTHTVSQDTTNAPKSNGFGYAYKVDCTTANASPAAGAYFILSLKNLEGRRLQHLNKGTPNAEALTISFWVRSSKTGNFVVELQDIDNARHIASLVTINVANTWEYKTVTFAGDTTGALDNDNASSLQLNIWLGAGTDFSSGTLSTSWAAQSNANRAVGCGNWADNIANDFYITGIQLEVGENATEFEHRSYSDVLFDVQEFYYAHVNGINQAISSGWAYSTTQAEGFIHFPRTMRSTPSLVATSGTDYYAFVVNGANDLFNSLTLTNASPTTALVYNNSEISSTAGQAGRMRTNNALAFIAFDARL